MSVNVKALIGKLNDTTRNALEAAAGLCVTRTHYDVELEHYLLKLLDNADCDASRILRHFGISTSRFAADLLGHLDRLKTGNARTPSLSPSLLLMLTEAWTLGSVEYDARDVRTGFTLLALAATPQLARMTGDISLEFQKLSADALRSNFALTVAGSPEGKAGAPQGSSPAIQPSGIGGSTAKLDQFTIDLTENARAGKLDPVLGRDFEIRQVVDILMRRRQNNPILTGEAGVGKTAVVEGFALRVAQGDVPPALRTVAVRSLDLALLQAGAGIKGEFENRLKGLIQEVKSSPQPIILFIDEAHTMIGAGGQAGQNDAANLLKPALARGELRTIAATTWSEYKRYFEKDAALARRFQVVKVDEPSEEQCMVMLRGIAPSLEAHHKVRVLDEAVSAAVRLSHRYLAGRQLPDKAVSVVDTACARLTLGHSATPAPVEAVTREFDDLSVQIRILEREAAAGADHGVRLQLLSARRAEVQQRIDALRSRWEHETKLVEQLRAIREQLEQRAVAAASGQTATTSTDAPVSALRAEMDRLNHDLFALQGEAPLMRACVDAQVVSEVISGWTGIPVGKMLKDEIQSVLNLPAHLGQRVIGQGDALEVIAQRVLTSKASMDDPRRPVGVFLLAGPSGVGKTETALALSEFLFGGENNLITINMSEFQEPHTVSTLKGSPPGYVGYGEGGVLTEAVRRRPYSVVLLDEVEKAHPDVLELFYQVFDKGIMEDGEGRQVDFKNTIIILTSNAGTDMLMKLTADPETTPALDGLVRALKPELNRIFKPAFLGRLNIVPYMPLRDETLQRIIQLKLSAIERRIRDNHNIELRCQPAVLEEIAKRCIEVESGARNVDNILTNTLLPGLSRLILSHLAEGGKMASLTVDVGQDNSFVYHHSSTMLAVKHGLD